MCYFSSTLSHSNFRNRKMVTISPWLLFTIAWISSSVKYTDGFESDWKKCSRTPEIRAEGIVCPYQCLDFFVEDIACKADGVTPISCSGSRNKCPNGGSCERNLCLKVPCYEPADHSRYSPAFYLIEMCKLPKRKEDNRNVFTSSPGNKHGYSPDMNNSGDINNTGDRTGAFSAVFPVMVILVVIVTTISILNCCMRKRQSRPLQNRALDSQVLSERPLIENSVMPKPVQSGARPRTTLGDSDRQFAGSYSSPSAPCSTHSYFSSMPAGIITAPSSSLPYPSLQTEAPPYYNPPRNDSTILSEPFTESVRPQPNITLNPVNSGDLPPPNRAMFDPQFAGSPLPCISHVPTGTPAPPSNLPYPSQETEAPPSYSPPRNEMIPSDAPPSYFMATRENLLDRRNRDQNV